MYEQIIKNTCLRRYCTFHIGGNADLLKIVYCANALIDAMACGGATVLGKGSNVLIGDGGLRGTVVINRSDGLTLTDGGADFCEFLLDSGFSVVRLCAFAAQNDLAGLEFACSIPGTIGGAVKGNAGAFGGAIADVVVRVQVLRDGKLIWLSNLQCAFTYRGSAIADSDLITRVVIKLVRGEQQKIVALMRAFKRERLAKQPAGFSAGSVFKATDKAAGYYIDKAGLKGFSVGQAYISDIHANFIINSGLCSASDVITLINTAKAKVFDLFGVRLVEEIKFLGEY